MPDLDIREILMLRGPNIWANYQVLEAWVDLGNLKDASSEEIPGFNERLMECLPGLIEHRCSVGERGGFLQRLNRGTYPAHILEHVTLEMQTLAGHPVGYGKARATCVEGLYKVVFRYIDETVAETCLRSARDLLLALYNNEPFDVAAEVKKLQEVVDRNSLGPSTKAMVDAARERDIPWRRLQEGRSLVQFGHGVKQRRIWTAETDRSGAIAEYIAQDKDLSRTVLSQAGVPMPEGRIVADPEDAWVAAQDIGLPVVVKPRDANHGRGVFVDLHTKEQIVDCFELADKEGNGVMVESFIPGTDHRLLVVGKNLVAASRGDPAIIVGDGKSNVTQLIETQLNTDPRRGSLETSVWGKINVEDWDSSVLTELRLKGHSPTTVPHAGERVIVSRFANWAIDITDSVHPSIRDHVTTAARVVGLDIAGIDVVCKDISKPLEEQDGAIVEINASPGLLMHLKPSVGKVRPVGEAIIDMLFEPEDDGRIPIVGVTGSSGKTTAIRLLSHIIAATGKRIGVASSDGLQFGRRFVKSKVGDHNTGSQGVLLHPWTEVAVCEVSTECILREGIGFDRCQVGVVTNVSRDQLGMNYIDTLEQMAKVKRCIVDIVLHTGTAVLNADDPLVAEMAAHCKGGVLYFSRFDDSPVLKAHAEAGHRTLFVKDNAILLAEGTNQRTLCPLSDVPLPLDGPFTFHYESALSAIGAAWALGIADATIAAALCSYGPQAGEAAAELAVA